MFQAVAAATDSVGAGEEQVLHHTPIGMPQVEQYMRKMQLQEQKEFLFWNTQPVPKISEWLLQLVYFFILMAQTECMDKCNSSDVEHSFIINELEQSPEYNK